jgi:hypothetical protein
LPSFPCDHFKAVFGQCQFRGFNGSFVFAWVDNVGKLFLASSRRCRAWSRVTSGYCSSANNFSLPA